MFCGVEITRNWTPVDSIRRCSRLLKLRPHKESREGRCNHEQQYSGVTSTFDDLFTASACFSPFLLFCESNCTVLTTYSTQTLTSHNSNNQSLYLVCDLLFLLIVIWMNVCYSKLKNVPLFPYLPTMTMPCYLISHPFIRLEGARGTWVSTIVLWGESQLCPHNSPMPWPCLLAGQNKPFPDVCFFSTTYVTFFGCHPSTPAPHLTKILFFGWKLMKSFPFQRPLDIIETVFRRRTDE